MDSATFSPQQEAIITSLSRGANRASASHAAGLPLRTFYNWIKSDAAFSEAVEEAEAESIGVAEDLAYACAMKAIEDPRYLRALFFWLKHRAGWIQARHDPTPQSTPAIGVQRAAPSPQEAAPAENPLNGVPSVPSEAAPGDASLTSARRDTPLACPPSEPAPVPTHPEENPGMRVPSVPPIHPSSPVARTSNVPFVPSEATVANALQSAPNLPASNNPKSAIQNPKSVVPSVPSVPSRKRDRMHQQRFKKKRRR